MSCMALILKLAGWGFLLGQGQTRSVTVKRGFFPIRKRKTRVFAGVASPGVVVGGGVLDWGFCVAQGKLVSPSLPGGLLEWGFCGLG